MILAYLKSNPEKPETITQENGDILTKDTLIWIDVVSPTIEEQAILQKNLKISIPTREEMLEIEVSSRLYLEKDSLYMTANMLARSEDSEVKTDVVTLIYTDDKLITIRYNEAQMFNLFAAKVAKFSLNQCQPINLILELLDICIDRLADTLECVGMALDNFSQTIFRSHSIDTKSKKMDYKKLLKNIGSNGDLTTKVGESLISLNLLLTFFGQSVSFKDNNQQSKLAILEKDVLSLSNHAHFQSDKINFLLDATLGMVTIEQNAIIKIFSIAAVMFLPPTLIASIYGMNFKFMPELSWKFGYPLVITLMVFSAFVPYRLLKKKGWL